jgi:hypothetical protein
MKNLLTLFGLVLSFSALSIERPPDCADHIALAPGLREVWTKMFNVPDVDGDVDLYLAESNAEADYRSFQIRPGDATRGEPRLVINVSPQTWPIYLRHFGGRHIFENLSYANNQALSYMRWRGETFLGPVVAAMPPPGTIGLPILISENEAVRVHRALYIMSQYPGSHYGGYQYPFRVQGYGFPNFNYYQNCSAWPGLMMAGDRLVTQVEGPGNLEHNRDAPPIVGQLTPYPMPPEIQPEDQEIFRAVFSVPGHQTLWESWGFPLRDGDFTSAGWFSHTLLGRASTERLPIVVNYTTDHTLPIPEIVNPNIYLHGLAQPNCGPDGLHH